MFTSAIDGVDAARGTTLAHAVRDLAAARPSAAGFTHAPLSQGVLTHPLLAHSTSLITSGLGYHWLTLLKVLSRARKLSCDHGAKFGGGRSSLERLGRGREMTEQRWSRVESEVLDVLCRSRFRARSRASSKAIATADARLLLVTLFTADELSKNADFSSEGLFRASRAW
jgi:hypothetical protein